MENISSNLYKNSLDAASAEQLKFARTWGKFNGIVYSILSVTVALTCLLLFFNFDAIIKVMSKFNGMSPEMLEIMKNGGKPSLIFFTIVCFTVLFYNGYLLLKFNRTTSPEVVTDKEALYTGLDYLNKYFKFSIILSIISLTFSLLFTLMVLSSAN